MKLIKLQKNKKAISPIFATLILIAIAVIAGIVVYMFTSGFLSASTGPGTTGTEKVAVQAVEGAGAGGTIYLYAQSTGGGNVTIDSIIVKTGDGTVFDAAAVATTVGTTDPEIGDSLTTVTVTLSGTKVLTSGTSYSVTIISVAGNQFVSPAFKAS